uniref:Uncharacterized protein n=1 Tax=Malurus cyaneus samueli TaxID=2593467 RepID=A0A8C5UJG3_9PASS
RGGTERVRPRPPGLWCGCRDVTTTPRGTNLTCPNWTGRLFFQFSNWKGQNKFLLIVPFFFILSLKHSP